jgi:phage tail sheath gpL-like
MASYTNLLLTSESALTPVITGTDSRDKAVELAQAVKAMAAGVRNGEIKVHLDGVRASATITIDNSKATANDTIKIGATTLTIKASGANGTTEFNKGTDATATAVNLAAVINANTTLSTYLSATSALGVVTITCRQPGLIGNAIGITVTENTPSSFVPSAALLANGTNGTVSTLTFGL